MTQFNEDKQKFDQQSSEKNDLAQYEFDLERKISKIDLIVDIFLGIFLFAFPIVFFFNGIERGNPILGLLGLMGILFDLVLVILGLIRPNFLRRKSAMSPKHNNVISIFFRRFEDPNYTVFPIYHNPWEIITQISKIILFGLKIIGFLGFNVFIVYSIVDSMNKIYYHDLDSSIPPLMYLGYLCIGFEVIGLFLKYTNNWYHRLFMKYLYVVSLIGIIGGSIIIFIIGMNDYYRYNPTLKILGFLGILITGLIAFGRYNQLIIQPKSIQALPSKTKKSQKKKRLMKVEKISLNKSQKQLLAGGLPEIEILKKIILPEKKKKFRLKNQFMRWIAWILFSFALFIGNVLLITSFYIGVEDGEPGFGLLGFFGIVGEIIYLFWGTSFTQNLHLFWTKQRIRWSLIRATHAKEYEINGRFRKARRFWRKSKWWYNKALKKAPKIIQTVYISQIILLIQKKIGFNYLSQGISISTTAWEAFQEKKYKNALGKYKLATKIVEEAIRYIENQERITLNFGFTIKISTIYEILKLFQMIVQQIETESKFKKQANVFQTKLDLQEIFDEINNALQEINDTIWIYNDEFIVNEKYYNQGEIGKLFDVKLTQSLHAISNLQDRITSLIQYLQSADNEGILKDSKFPLTNFAFSDSKSSSKATKVKTEDEKRSTSPNQDSPSVKIIREYEYIGGKIRFKIGLVNLSSQVITNLAIRFDLPDALKWIIHEPTYVRRGDTILIPKLGGNEKIALSLYLEPINCLQSSINATLTYFDTNDHPQAVIMPPKKVSITCPIFFTREDANIARVKSIQQKLKYSDKKVFPMGTQNDKEMVFNHILDVIGRHDVKLVDKEYSHKEKTGEAWFYGLTKVKKQKMVIKLILDSNHHSLEVNVNGDNQEPITGLLAELEGQIREKLLMSKIITDGSTFNDISTSILLGSCPYCNGPIDPDWISLYKKGEIITCKYCDTPIIPY